MDRKEAIDRRRGIRAKRILSIRHRLHKRRGKVFNDEWHLSTTEDMSTSGLLFLTSWAYLPGDLVELHVVMSGILDIFRGYGKVVRVQKKEMGVLYLVAIEYFALKSKIRPRRAKSYARK